MSELQQLTVAARQSVSIAQ